jgi:general secretion pathway protein K
VSVLPPSSTQINVNFAPAEVLEATIKGLGRSEASALYEQLKTQFFMKLQDFKDFLQKKGLTNANSSNIGDFVVTSTYFLVNGTATMGNAQVVTKALLDRTNNWPTVVWQSVQ